MWLAKWANSMEKGISPFITVVGRIGAAFIAFIMLLTVADVIGRRAFNHPIGGAYELSELMLIIVAFGTMASCELIRGHVTIDLVVTRFPQRAQAITNSLMYLGFLVISSLIAWRLFVYATREIGGQVTAVLQVPIYPFVYIAALGGVLLSLVILMHIFEYLAGALKR